MCAEWAVGWVSTSILFFIGFILLGIAELKVSVLIIKTLSDAGSIDLTNRPTLIRAIIADVG